MADRTIQMNNERYLKLKVDILDMASPMAHPRLLK